jgi:hypothetical protein
MIDTIHSTAQAVLQPQDETLTTTLMQQAMVEAWQQLQQTSSYFEEQITLYRGLIESVASQH